MNSFNFKVGLFALTSLLLGAAFTVYVLYARGFFEDSFRLQLAAPSADGVVVGTPISFSGMDIGQVTAIELSEAGGIVIDAKLPAKNAKWLRESSSFTLDKPIVGGAKIRVASPDLDAPLLKDDSTALLLTSDVTREIPVLVERVKAILANVEHLTRKDGEIVNTLANVQTVTGRMTGEYGVLEGVFGSQDKARALTDSLAETRALLVKVNGIAARVDGTLAKTDTWLFEPGGVAEHTRESLGQVRVMLTDVSATLKKADALMANAVAISSDVKDGTRDIAKLRSEIDESVRRVNGLVNELNKKWPFARDVEVKLP